MDKIITFGFPYIILLVIFYFILIRPQQLQKKKQQDFLSSLKRGDEVVTQGGIYGKIVDLGKDTVSLQIANKVTIKVLRSKIVTFSNKQV